MHYLRLLLLTLSIGSLCFLPADAPAAAVKKDAASSKKITAGSRPQGKTLASRKATSSNKARTRKQKNRAIDPQMLMDRARQGDLLSGQASWYGRDFHGGKTSSGLPYDMYSYTAAHRTLPFGTVVKVTDERTGRSTMVCINNRGPFVRGRIIDLSYAAAEDLGIQQRGVTSVNLEVVSDPEGQVLNEEEAFYVRLGQNAQEEPVGPFVQYADASVMQEALRGHHPEAAIVMGQRAR